MEVVAGLNMTAVERLKRSWAVRAMPSQREGKREREENKGKNVSLILCHFFHTNDCFDIPGNFFQRKRNL
jgi:hypothetical protein